MKIGKNRKIGIFQEMREINLAPETEIRYKDVKRIKIESLFQTENDFMIKFRHCLAFILIAALLAVGAVGCHSFRPHSKPKPEKVHDNTTVEGWVGGERPSF